MLDPPWANIACERLGLLDADIWLQDHMRQIVGDAALALALETPMEWESDLMHLSACNFQRNDHYIQSYI